MSTGYDTVTNGDFTNYMVGGTAFERATDGTGEVTAWSMIRIGDGNSGDHAANNYCTLVKVGGDNESKQVPISTLLQSRDWILHRFPVRYLTNDSETALASVTLEPRERRMIKSTTAQFMRNLTCVSEGDPELIQRLPVVGSVTRGLSSDEVMRGIARVLSYGHHQLFFPVNTQCARDCNAEVREMIASDTCTRKVVVPDSHTAIALSPRPDFKDGEDCVLINQSVILGTLTLVEDNIQLTSDYSQPFSGADRSMIEAGVEHLLRRLFGEGSTVNWRYES